MLGGLSTPEIARAFLVQRGDRRAADRAREEGAGRRAVRDPGRRRAAPSGLAGVLEVVYLIFNEGYSATAGEDWVAPGAVRGRAPARPRALRPGAARGRGLGTAGADGDPGFAHARPRRSRRHPDPARRPGPLALGPAADSARPARAAPRRRRWGWASTGCRPRSPPATPAQRVAADTDWVQIAALYETLARVAPSPVVELNRAVAIGMAFGPEAALRHVDALVAEPSLSSYHLLPSRPRRPAGEGGTRGRSTRRVRARGIADVQHRRTRPPARPRRFAVNAPGLDYANPRRK